MPAAGVVLLITVVAIVLVLVYYLVSTIVALRTITAGLDEAIAGVGEIIEKSAPVEEIVTSINRNLDVGVDLLEGLLVKKAGRADAPAPAGGLYPGPPAPGFRTSPGGRRPGRQEGRHGRRSRPRRGPLSRRRRRGVPQLPGEHDDEGAADLRGLHARHADARAPGARGPHRGGEPGGRRCPAQRDRWQPC